MSQPQRELKGIWWNVWHDARDHPNGAQKIAERVIRITGEHDPDWICLQEAYRYDAWGREGNLVRLIQEATGWDNIFVVGNQYHYANGRAGRGNNYSEGVVTFSKWPILQHEVISLGPSAWGEQQGLGGERTLLETLLDTPLGKITVGNAHWTRIRHNYRKHRKNEMNTFRERIESLPKDLAYVVGGDFNTLPTHPIIRRLGKTLDLQSGGVRKKTWVHKGKKGNFIRCNLDYVGALLSGPLDFLQLHLLDRRPSDHAPLLATFEANSEVR